jgi:hypothetical protein
VMAEAFVQAAIALGIFLAGVIFGRYFLDD